MTRLRSRSKSASEVGTRPRSADSMAHASMQGHTSPSPVPGQLLGGAEMGEALSPPGASAQPGQCSGGA